jgi:hypothetical protein
MVAAVQEFVDRCELGEIRSKHTYGKMKSILLDVRRTLDNSHPKGDS